MTTKPRWRDQLLPNELRGGPAGHRSARDWAVDAVMAVLAASVGVVVLVDSWSRHGTALAVVDVALGVVSLLALWWRRQRPDAVGALTVAASVVSALASGPALVGSFNVALRGSRRGILTVIALTAVAIAAFPLVYPPGDSYLLNLVIGVLLAAVVFGWGLLARVRREQLLSLREQAREAERRRIAREMHDVLAHRVSLLSLHAGALEFRPDAPPADIAEAAAELHMSVPTVKAHVSQLLAKLDVENRIEVALLVQAAARAR